MDRTSLVYSRNGSLNVFNQDDSSSVVAAAIVLVCFLLGVFYNTAVMAAIVSSRRLRNCPFNIILAMITSICLADCFTNEGIAFETLWYPMYPPCNFSSFVFHFLLFAHSSALAFIVLQRRLDIQGYKLKTKTWLGGVSMTLFLSLLMTFPIFLNEVYFFPKRNACGVVGENLLFPLSSLLVYVICWVLTATNVFFIIRDVKQKNDSENQLNIISVQSTVLRNNQPTEQPLDYKSKITNTLVFLHIILLLPLIITTTIHLFLDPNFELDVWEDPRFSDRKTISTTDLDPLFVYCRYFYNTAVPIAILTTDRDIRLRSRLIFCCKRNEISNLDFGFQKRMKNKKTSLPVDCKYPILFATSRGLHLRTPYVVSQPPGQLETNLLQKPKIKLVSRFCDLTTDSNSERKNSIITNRENPEENKCHDVRKNVHFSSKIEAIPSESGIWSGASEENSSEKSNQLECARNNGTKGQAVLNVTYIK